MTFEEDNVALNVVPDAADHIDSDADEFLDALADSSPAYRTWPKKLKKMKLRKHQPNEDDFQVFKNKKIEDNQLAFVESGSDLSDSYSETADEDDASINNFGQRVISRGKNK